MARRLRGQRKRGGQERGQGEERSQLAGRLEAATPEEAISLLEQAEIVAHEMVPAGTNYTFAVLMSAGGRSQFLAIYKPQRGENPLWDFPDGTLYLRERAAYLTSRELGWPNVPPTTLREGPYGVGMVQLYVSTEGQPDFFAFRHRRHRDLMEIALFDLLVNNADRKAGHCLLGVDGRVWAIDHGLTFNVAPKLRTVLWDFCGELIPERLLSDLETLRDDTSRRQGLREQLEPCLQSDEIDALFRRLESILQARRFPQLDPRRNVPWPLA